MKIYRKITTWFTGEDYALESKLAALETADSREFWRLALGPVWRVSTLSTGMRSYRFHMSPLCREPFVAMQKAPNAFGRFLMYFQGYRFKGPKIFELDFEKRGAEMRLYDKARLSSDLYEVDLKPADEHQIDPNDLTDN